MPTGAELRAAVLDCERQRIDEAYVAEAKCELGELTLDCAEQRSQWTEQRQETTRWGSGRQPVLDLFAGGHSIEEVAHGLGTTIEEVVSTFTQDATPAEVVLELERQLRAGADSYLGVAKATGLTDATARRLAEILRLEPKTAQTLKSGGGYKYTAEQIAEVLRLKSETDLTNAQVGQQMGGLTGDQVKAIHRRHGAKVIQSTSDIGDNSQLVETVAA